MNMPSKCIDLGDFLILKRHELAQARLVFTNGCFDLLHPGHIKLLEEAQNLGDILIVGLNSDVSVRHIKGPSRPITPQQDRAIILASIQWVDYIIIFNDPTPLALIQAIVPDVLIKGGDWSPETIIGSELVLKHGGQVLSLPFCPGYSTTGLIQKILEKNTVHV
jgi:D-beta-D-heptose 7-phosphate kinase/D-beta-D-heptose 1-phosphate adenosyltransferase